MLLKSLKIHLKVALIFSLVVLGLCTLPIMERIILKEKSIVKRFTNDFWMGPFQYDGCLTEREVYRFNLKNFDNVINSEKKKKLQEIWQKIKKNLNDDSIKVISRYGGSTLTIINQGPNDISHVFNKYKEINCTKKKDCYDITLSSKEVDQIRTSLIDQLVNSIKNRLINDKISYYNVSFFDTTSNTKREESQEMPHLKIEIQRKDEEKFSLNKSNSVIDFYALTDASNMEAGEKKVIHSKQGALPVLKDIIISREDIESINWIEHEESSLLSFKLNKSGEQKFTKAKEMNLDTLIVTTGDLALQQTDFKGGFSVLNDLEGQNNIKNCIGFVSIKMSTANNMILQTMFNNNSKEKITKYFNEGTLPFELQDPSVNIEKPIIKEETRNVLLLILFALILAFLLLIILMFRQWGLLCTAQILFQSLLVAFVLRILNIQMSLSVISLLFFLFIIISSLEVRRMRKLQSLRFNYYEDSPMKFSAHKEIIKKETSKTIIFSLLAGVVDLILLISFRKFSYIFAIFLTVALCHLIVYLFFWQNSATYLAGFLSIKSTKKKIN